MDNKKVSDKIDLNAIRDEVPSLLQYDRPSHDVGGFYKAPFGAGAKKAAVYKAPLVREAIVSLPIPYSSGAARRRKKNC